MYRKYLNILLSGNGRCRWSENLTQCHRSRHLPLGPAVLVTSHAPFCLSVNLFSRMVAVFHSVFLKNCNFVAKFYLNLLRVLVQIVCHRTACKDYFVAWDP